MEKAVYINSVSAYLPNSPIANEDMEDYIGKIGGNPSRVRSIVLRQNGIKTRYYGLDKKQNLTHSNAGLAKEAVCGLFENGTIPDDLTLLACGTSTPDQLLPSHASMVHGELANYPMEIFSSAGVCLTSLQALKICYSNILAGLHQKAVCVASELTSPALVLFMSLFLVSVFSQKTWGQVSFYDARVSEYGQLEQVLGDKWNAIDSLVVYGPINEADFTTMWKCSFEGKLTVLNLEHAQVENYKIPECAFFKRDRQVIDDPRAYQGVIYLPLRRLILPEGIREIGDYAFSRMKLEQVNIPKSLRKLGRSCFSNCHWLSTEPLIIPEGITTIPIQCFINCQCFKNIVLPSTLKVIKACAFYNTRVAEVNFPEGLESIEIGAFAGSDLIEAILPNTVQKLEESIFSMCPALKKIQLPENIDTIPFCFASWCPLLETVNIPNSVIAIEKDAFMGDVKLKPLDLPDGLKRIEQDAFWYCAVDSIVFPTSLEYLGGGSCANWKHIKKIYSLSSNPPFCAEDFANPGKGPFHGYTPNDIPVYVPIGSGEKYRKAFGWNYFTNIIETDKFPTGIVSPKMDNGDQCKVYGRDGKLFIELPNVSASPVRYSVYSIGGSMIEQGNLTKSYTLKMPSKGVYIVRVGNTTHKIFL